MRRARAPSGIDSLRKIATHDTPHPPFALFPALVYSVRLYRGCWRSRRGSPRALLRHSTDAVRMQHCMKPHFRLYHSPPTRTKTNPPRSPRSPPLPVSTSHVTRTLSSCRHRTCRRVLLVSIVLRRQPDQLLLSSFPTPSATTRRSTCVPHDAPHSSIQVRAHYTRAPRSRWAFRVTAREKRHLLAA